MERGWKQRAFLSVELPKPLLQGHPAKFSGIVCTPCNLLTDAVNSKEVQIWVCSSFNRDAVSLLNGPRAPFTVSLKALLEMKAVALPLLASHLHLLYCKTNKQNKTHCYISKHW